MRNHRWEAGDINQDLQAKLLYSLISALRMKSFLENLIASYRQFLQLSVNDESGYLKNIFFNWKLALDFVKFDDQILISAVLIYLKLLQNLTEYLQSLVYSLFGAK